MMQQTKKIIISDPIYGTITIEDKLIQNLVASTFFQRLRRIQQMSVAHLTFPGAVHSRFQHSLGAYHLMTLALNELENKGVKISVTEKQAAQIAILLHDIGHGPFSHTLEGTILKNSHHEEVSLAIMNFLNQQHKGKLNLAIEIFKGTYKRNFFHQLVSGQLDVDRLDYLTRDSFYAGVAEGIIGYERIINMMTVFNDELVILEKGVYSVEQFLISRRIMYWQVYHHKMVWAAEQLVKNILSRVNELYLKNFFNEADFFSLFFFIKNKFQPNNKKHLEIFNRLDDADIFNIIKFGSQCQDKILAMLCTAFLNRNMYQVKIYNSEKEKVDTHKIAQKLKSQIHISEKELSYFILEKTISTTLYDDKKKDLIQIVNQQHALENISNMPAILIGTGMKTSQSKFYQGFWRT